MEWQELTKSPLSDMLRDELIAGFIRDADKQYREHRASAGKFAAAGNDEMALLELNTANAYRRQRLYWEAQLGQEGQS